jgi:hypothetical protein
MIYILNGFQNIGRFIKKTDCSIQPYAVCLQCDDTWDIIFIK